MNGKMLPSLAAGLLGAVALGAGASVGVGWTRSPGADKPFQERRTSRRRREARAAQKRARKRNRG